MDSPKRAGLVQTLPYDVLGIEHEEEHLAKLNVPSSTDARIDKICSRIRELSRGPFSPEDEAEIRRLAIELRGVINEHVQLAKSSLGAKQSAITARDPEAA